MSSRVLNQLDDNVVIFFVLFRCRHGDPAADLCAGISDHLPPQLDSEHSDHDCGGGLRILHSRHRGDHLCPEADNPSAWA